MNDSMQQWGAVSFQNTDHQCVFECSLSVHTHATHPVFKSVKIEVKAWTCMTWAPLTCCYVKHALKALQTGAVKRRVYLITHKVPDNTWNCVKWSSSGDGVRLHDLAPIMSGHAPHCKTVTKWAWMKLKRQHCSGLLTLYWGVSSIIWGTFPSPADSVGLQHRRASSQAAAVVLTFWFCHLQTYSAKTSRV